MGQKQMTPHSKPICHTGNRESNASNSPFAYTQCRASLVTQVHTPLGHFSSCCTRPTVVYPHSSAFSAATRCNSNTHNAIPSAWALHCPTKQSSAIAVAGCTFKSSPPDINYSLPWLQSMQYSCNPLQHQHPSPPIQALLSSPSQKPRTSTVVSYHF